MLPYVSSTLFSCFADREKCKVLTVVLKRHMTLDLIQKRKTLTNMLSSNFPHIIHSKKNVQVDSKTMLLVTFCCDQLVTPENLEINGQTLALKSKKITHLQVERKTSFVFLFLSDLCLEDRTAAPSRMVL